MIEQCQGYLINQDGECIWDSGRTGLRKTKSSRPCFLPLQAHLFHSSFCLQAGLLCLPCSHSRSWPSHHPWNLPIIVIATHKLEGRTSTFPVPQVGCAERRHPLKWDTHSKGPQELEIMREELQNATWREPFAHLTASLSAWIRSSWKEPRGNQFFWT